MIKSLSLFIFMILLTGCALSPQQQREREAEKIRQQQVLQVLLAKQCDEETAYLMKRHFDQDIGLSEQEQKRFEEEYTNKVNNPMFQACYQLALQNYVAQQQIKQLEIERQFYDDYPPYRLGRPFFRRHHWRYW